jgi:hypothetical protein
VGSDNDWLTLNTILFGAYAAWLSIAVSRFKGMDIRPSEFIFIRKKRHQVKRDLEQVRPLALWLAILPTVATLGLTGKTVTMLVRLDWAKPPLPSLTVLITYLIVGACAVTGWIRVVTIKNRLEGLAAATP